MDQAALMKLIAAQNGSSLAPGLDPATCDPQELIQRVSQQNPALGAVMQMMVAQRASAPAQEPPAIESGLVAVENGGELAELHEQLEAALAEVQVLRERCDTFAAAVGACALCWGEEPTCRACRGRGGPGRCLPDEQLFSEYVLPGVRLMHASRQRSRNVTSPSTAPNGSSKADVTPVRLTS